MDSGVEPEYLIEIGCLWLLWVRASDQKVKRNTDAGSIPWCSEGFLLSESTLAQILSLSLPLSLSVLYKTSIDCFRFLFRY